MSVAERTREAVRQKPFLRRALRAGVVNYTAAAAMLDVGGVDDDDGDGHGDSDEAVAAALRRYAADLPAYAERERAATVRMRRGVDVDADDGTWRVDGDSDGDLTAVVAAGDVDVAALGAILARLDAADVDVEAASVADGRLFVAVGKRDGTTALRLVESALAAVPE